MPAVETWPASPAAAGQQSFGSSAKAPSEQAPEGGDFDSVMQATLAPPPHKPTGKNPAHTAKGSPADALAAGSAPATEAEPGDNADTSQKADDKHKSPAVTTDKSLTEISASDVPANTAQPLPTFFSPPVFLSNPFSNPVAGKSSAGPSSEVEKIPVADSLAVGAVAANAAPESGKATPATLPAGTLASLAVLDATQAAGATATNQKQEVLEMSSSREEAKAPTLPAPAPEKDVAKAEATATSPATASASSQAPPAGELPAALPASDTAAPAPDKAEDILKENTDLSISLVPAAGRDGTGVAMTSLPMKNSQKATKLAGPDAKVLPVSQNGEAVEKNLPTPLLVSPVRAAENRGSDQNFTFSDGSNHSSATGSAQTLNVVDLPSLADARMRSLERTHDMLALHSMRLVESKSDVLSVVIKPAVGTELSLELHQHEGVVEARATLTRGDHEFLSQHWPELQQRLELRGIKLAPLGGETGFSPNGSGNFQQQQFSQEEEAQQASAFAEFAAASASGGATARLAAIHEGWESWA